MWLSEAVILVIFGASGDLAHRKLVPALYNLFLDARLPEKFAVIGISRKEWSVEKFQSHLLTGVNEFSRRGQAKEHDWARFKDCLQYLSLDLTIPASYGKLSSSLKKQEELWQEKTESIFYLAIEPDFISLIVDQLSDSRLLTKGEGGRIVIEKPFGHNIASAIQLNQTLVSHLVESQIFRIDHFLGKETVQNILALRFANILFEPIWNRNYIDNVQITVAEEIGIDGRGVYYEKAGALRDMLENHLFQLLGLIAMEPPSSLDQEEIRNKKMDVLHAIRAIPGELVTQRAVRGQYNSYRQEAHVDPSSNTETYAAIKLFIDNWRWQDIPFYLRTGKRMKRRIAEISLQFRSVPHRAFPETETWVPNQLRIQIQPEEEITLQFQAKVPGSIFQLKPVQMKFSYKDSFSQQSPEAYETLLLDIFMGDASSFVRADQEKAAWQVITPVLEEWEHIKPDHFPNYAAGSWGPRAAEELLERDGKQWLLRD